MAKDAKPLKREEEEVPLNPDTNSDNIAGTSDEGIQVQVDPESEPPAPAEDETPKKEAPLNYPYIEWKIRQISYLIFFVLFISMSWDCYNVGEGVLTLCVVICLVLWRLVTTRKFCPVEDHGGSKLRRCGSFMSCLIATVAILAGLISLNWLQGRFKSGDEREQLCAFSDYNNTNENGTEDIDIEHGSTNNSTTKYCFITCDVLYFYPLALLSLDLLYYTGLFTPLIIKPTILLGKAFADFCSRKPASTVLYGILIFLYVVYTIGFTSGSIFFLYLFNYTEKDYLMFCIILTILCVYFITGFFVSLFQKRLTNWIPVAFVVFGLFLAGLLLSSQIVGYFVRKYLYGYPHIHLKCLVEDIWLWIDTGVLSLVQIFLFSAISHVPLKESKLSKSHALAAFCLPFFPIIFVVGLFALINWLISKFFCVIAEHSGLYGHAHVADVEDNKT